MREAVYKNRWLILLVIFLIIFAFLMTMFPVLQAEASGPGRCYARYYKYWSSEYGAYITVKYFACTGYVAPRRMRYR